jgi:GDSL-like Lipase/Acylhydrolase family
MALPRHPLSTLPLAAASLLLVSAFAACSGSDDGIVAGTPLDGGAANAETGAPGTDGGGPVADGSPPASSDIPKPTACPTAKYQTLVVVGDSISDVGGSGGGAGQEPFYRTLLVKNDDALYPEWKGFDLSTCWGLDGATNVVKVSKGGAVATVPANNDPSDKGILLNQVTSLPATLPGPVLVVGTIGGNDVQAGLVTVLTGSPAQVQAKIDAFVAGFGQAMAEITKPDRFGAGVKVSTLITNVYDPSGGTGHFYYEPEKKTCPGALGFWPDNKETTTLLGQWNGAMATEAAKYPGVKLLELRAPFAAHAVSTAAATNWFYHDCIHPSSLGHDAVRGVMWAGLRSLP